MPIFRLLNVFCWKFAKLLLSFLKAKSVFLQILHQYSVPSNITHLYFFSSNMIYFGQKHPIKVQFLEFLIAQVKIHQILHVNFELTSQFLFNFCITFSHTHTFLTLGKRMSSKSQFCWDLQELWWKFAKFLMSLLEAQVSFSSNFVSILSVIKHNFSVLSKLKHYILWSKTVH